MDSTDMSVSWYQTKGQTKGQTPRYVRSVKDCEINKTHISNLQTSFDQLENLAKRLKAAHKKALKFIRENNLSISDDWVTEFSNVIKDEDNRTGFQFLLDEFGTLEIYFKDFAQFIDKLKACDELKREFARIFGKAIGGNVPYDEILASAKDEGNDNITNDELIARIFTRLDDEIKTVNETLSTFENSIKN